MKISSGVYKGKTLTVPKSGVKPTSEKTRQAIMNILQDFIAGSKFMDLYAGTGGVGIEALSRGAGFVVFVEHSGRVYSILKSNLEIIVGDKSKYRTIKHNALQILDILPKEEWDSYDIVFADPFYQDSSRSLDDLHETAFSLLKEGGVFVLEHGSKENFKNYPGLLSQKFYGDTVLSLFRKT
jgi:16S rRNA (guanine(966)-N(2))-methyltransferase RsmD